jgi:hypothetical protein
MGCCNLQRAAVDLSTARKPAPALASRQVAIRFLGQGSVAVKGPVTGLTYAFSASTPRRGVDARDAPALLRTRLFHGS